MIKSFVMKNQAKHSVLECNNWPKNTIKILSRKVAVNFKHAGHVHGLKLSFLLFFDKSGSVKNYLMSLKDSCLN